MGRSRNRVPRFQTTTALNIRNGPATVHEKLPVSHLPTGTALEVVGERGSWRFVDVVEEVSGEMDVQGWVHGDSIRRVRS